MATLGHDFGLAQLLAGDAARTRIALHGGDDRALVRLDMRTIGDAGCIAQGLHPRNVALDHIEIDHHGGRPELSRDLVFESLDTHDRPRSCSDQGYRGHAHGRKFNGRDKNPCGLQRWPRRR
jgi:hypothetical protein